jgi:hypothetical protein
VGRHPVHRAVRHPLDPRGRENRQPHPAAVAASGPGEGRTEQPAACRRIPIRPSWRPWRPASTACCSPTRWRKTSTSGTVLRPEILQSPRGAQDFSIVEKKLTPFEQLYSQVWLRKVVLIVLLVLAWEIYAWNLNNQLLVPTFSATISIWWQGMLSGVLPDRAWTSLQGLAIGFTPGWRWRAS